MIIPNLPSAIRVVGEAILTVAVLGSLVFYSACALATIGFWRSPKVRPGTQPPHNISGPGSIPAPQPPLSLLVPACGVDAGAWANWSAFCEQDYPEYEVLFGVVEAQDPAVPVLERLREVYPDRMRLFVGLPPRGPNYKDSSLTYLLDEASHDWIVFADSDIEVDRNYLTTVTAPLADRRVGMVTCCFLGYRPRRLGAAMASLSRAVDFIPSLLLARILDGGLNCAVGATIATTREALNQYGGLQVNRIGSDYNIGKRAAAAGYRVELSRLVLESDTGDEPLASVYKRELRWSRTIRFNRGPQYYSMIFCYGTVLCWPLLLLSGGATWAIGLMLLTHLIRYGQIAICLAVLKAPNLGRWIWLMPLRDGMSFLVWLQGCYGRRVWWRGRRLRISGDGVIAADP
jgi:ceramide glucosyltransferase